MKKIYEQGIGMNQIPKKFIRVIKLFLLIVFALHASATVYSQDTRLSLNLQSSSIKDVFRKIESQTEFRFIYENESINLDRKINLKINNKSVEYILGELFKNEGVNYSVTEKNLILINPLDKDETVISQKELTIRGKVTDSQRQLLPGVTVVIKGTTIGTITDIEGNYSLSQVPGNAILIFSFVGMKTIEIEVANQNIINVALRDESIGLEEVVAIGYGTQTKSDVTGAISSIKSEDILSQGSNTVEKSLQGRVAGVQVESAGGSPGSGVRILIRGTGSLNNNSPLYIVDGVQVDNITNLNPSDIASMDILKDASAAAIYGSRAANGVVLITTKSGKKGESRIEFNAYYGFQKVEKQLDVLNASEWAQVSNAAHDNAGLSRLEIAKNPEFLGTGTDWQDEIYRSAPMQNYNLGVSGGGDNYTYSLSGAYLSQDGIVKRTNYDRWNMRVKSSLTKGRLKIGESILFSRESSRPFQTGDENGVAIAPMMIPVFDVYDPDAIGGYSGAYGQVANLMNPLAALNLHDNKDRINNITINVFAEVNILKDLKYKYNLGYTNTSGYEYRYTYPYQIGAFYSNTDADLSESRSQRDYLLQEHTLNYNKTFNKHSFQVLAGYTYQNTKYRSLSGAKSGMPIGSEVLDAGALNIAAGSDAWESVLISYLGRIIYSYDRRYVLTAILRRDGSSRFGAGNKYGNFPSIALAWNASNEAFFESWQSIFSTLKVRASYGVLGNQEIDDYRFSPSIILNTNYVVGQEQNLWSGAIQTNFATPDIKWETSKTFNFGLDCGFLKNKLNLNADYFIKKNSDILLQVPIPLSTGASSNSPYVNAGEITNKGFEVALSYKNKANSFTYELNATFSKVKNKVNILGSGSQQIFGGQPSQNGASATVTEAGLPVGAFYLVKADGIFNSLEEISKHNFNGNPIQPNAQPGDVKFVDYNNDGKIDQSDRQYCGSPTPKFSYGFGANMAWKGFDLNLFFQGTYGNKIYNGFRQELEGMNLELNYAKTTLNAWTPENHTDFPRAVINDPNYNGQTSDRFLENGSFLRFKTLQFGYTIPKQILSIANISNCRIYVSFDNLFTITNYKGYTPDLGRSGSILDRGVDLRYAAYPLAKTSMLGVQLNF